MAKKVPNDHRYRAETYGEYFKKGKLIVHRSELGFGCAPVGFLRVKVEGP